jgi:hypothetical protein
MEKDMSDRGIVEALSEVVPLTTLAEEREAESAPEAATEQASDERLAMLQAQLADAAILYRELALTAHPEVPADLIVGVTPQEVAASLAAAKATVDQVRQRLAAQAAAERVPAGAPARRTYRASRRATRSPTA